MLTECGGHTPHAPVRELYLVGSSKLHYASRGDDFAKPRLFAVVCGNNVSELRNGGIYARHTGALRIEPCLRGHREEPAFPWSKTGGHPMWWQMAKAGDHSWDILIVAVPTLGVGGPGGNRLCGGWPKYGLKQAVTDGANSPARTDISIAMLPLMARCRHTVTPLKAPGYPTAPSSGPLPRKCCLCARIRLDPHHP